MNRQRTFLLGDKWLYYKLYCGIHVADEIIVNILKEITEDWKNKGYIKKWFFIRYIDPEHHIRFRVELTDVSLILRVIKAFNESVKPYLTEGLLWKVQTDTYVRELERYGMTNIEITETIFFLDSILVSELLKLIENEELYFLFILRSVNQFVELFDLSRDQKLKFFRLQRNRFEKEFNPNKPTKISIDKKYRVLIGKINSFVNDKSLNPEFSELDDILTRRNTQISSEVKSILRWQQSIIEKVPLQNLLSSYVHMMVNRAFRSEQRFYEFLIYDYLKKSYISSLKRKSSHTNRLP